MTRLHHKLCSRCCRWKRIKMTHFLFTLVIITLTTTVAPCAATRHVSSSDTPAPDTSACTRSKHVVLASFSVPEAYHTVSLYFASKFPDTAVHHLWLHLGRDKTEKKDKETSKALSSSSLSAAMSSSTSSSSSSSSSSSPPSSTTAAAWAEAARHWPGLIKALAAAIEEEKSKDFRRKTPIDWRAFYRSHGIHRSVVDMSSIDDYYRLRRDYVHSSVNGYEYELLCFARFIGLRDFCTSKGIDQLTWIDADIPIFDPNFLDKVCLPQGYSTWALTSGSSFLNTMTCAEIGRFVDFMLDFYARENRHALVRAIQAHGSDNMASATHIAEQVRRAEPAFAELGIDPKHFSDMFLFSKFLQDTNRATEGKDEEPEREIPMGQKAITPERTPRRAYIHQDENNGTIDPYFMPILSIRNEVPHPELEELCVDDDMWNRYYSLRRSDGEAEGRGISPSMATPTTTTVMTRAVHPRLRLSFNQSGTWVPIAGAHFQGDDCKARLLDTFSKIISEDPGQT